MQSHLPLTFPAGSAAYVRGEVVLDGRDIAEIVGLPSGADRMRSGVLHELGHLIGLGHVNDVS